MGEGSKPRSLDRETSMMKTRERSGWKRDTTDVKPDKTSFGLMF